MREAQHYSISNQLDRTEIQLMNALGKKIRTTTLKSFDLLINELKTDMKEGWHRNEGKVSVDAGNVNI